MKCIGTLKVSITLDRVSDIISYWNLTGWEEVNDLVAKYRKKGLKW